MKSNIIKVYGSKMINVGTPSEESIKGDLLKTIELSKPITFNQAIDLEGNQAFCLEHGFKTYSIFITLS
jgi:hypothetical protein